MPNDNVVVEKCPNCKRTKKELDELGIEIIYAKGHNVFSYPLTEDFTCLCSECKEKLDDEFSDISHFITNESLEDFVDHEDLSK